MRRTLAALITSAVLIPIAVTALPGTASAATNTLTVHVYGRDGAKVKTKVSVVNLSTNSTYKLTSGEARKLPKGSYVALANIRSADGINTLGGRTVKVSGRSKTSIDARKGRRMTVAPSPAAPDGSGLSVGARICARNTTSAAVEAFTNPGKLYLIPNSSTNLRFAYTANWNESTATNERASYVVAGQTKGVPSGFKRSIKRSSLAAVTMNVRKGPAINPNVDISARVPSGGCAGNMGSGLENDQAPYRHKTYLSAGKWMLEAYSYSAFQWREISLEKGKSYSQTFYRSAWAPDARLPYVLDGKLSYRTDAMFQDPGFPDRPYSSGSNYYSANCCSRSVVTLTKGGKVLKKQTRTEWGADRTDFRYRLSSSGWYGLTIDAKRYHPELDVPSDLLSNRTTARFRFYANPKKDLAAGVFLPRFVPAGLDLHNSAKPGSTTGVSLTLHRPSAYPDVKTPAIKVKTVTAWASYDNGKTWKKVGVKKSGSKWVVTVKNPASGYVTLRTKVTDTKGNSSDVTVYRAYRIG
ncbi:hypothetical protein [Melissospora conviva]|uniref:hypothetical protein n=1 Tax=Melissospora conviva TaxID=3388432 RepID=UPI003C1FB735